MHETGLRRSPRTAISIVDPLPAEQAGAAVEALHATARHISAVQLTREVARSARYDALIYDLAPWDDSATELIHALRQTHRAVPILLYSPMRGKVSHVVDSCRALEGVRIKFQSHDRRELGELIQEVRWLHGAIHAERLIYLMDMLLPTLPDCTREYIRHILNRLAGGHRIRPLSVGALVNELDLPLHKLRRELVQGEFPSPKVLLDWITLLFASLSAHGTGRSMFAVAREFGVDTVRMYQIRRRLLAASVAELPPIPAQEFDLAFLAFAESCQVSRRDASTLLNKTA